MEPLTYLQVFNPEFLLSKGNTGTKSGAEAEGKGYLETAPPGDTYHMQTPNLDTIADAKKCLLTGA